jgi:hypothetical protein
MRISDRTVVTLPVLSAVGVVFAPLSLRGLV